MNLLIEYHKSKNIKRHSEFLTCLHENLGNPLIDKVYVFISDMAKLNFYHPKLQTVFISKRPTFKDLFEFYPLKNEICIISCADIIFDESIKHLEKLDDKTFAALTRWEIKFIRDKHRCELYNNAASQDVWAFRTPIKIPNDILDQMDFTAGGYWGCDNKIAYLLDKAGYELRNPSKQIKAQHFHSSDYRSVKITRRLPGPYLCLESNGNILEKVNYIRLEGFNELGQPILSK